MNSKFSKMFFFNEMSSKKLKEYEKLCFNLKAVGDISIKQNLSDDKKIEYMDIIVPELKLKKSIQEELKKSKYKNATESDKDIVKAKFLFAIPNDYIRDNMPTCKKYIKYKKSKDPDFVFPDTEEDLIRRGLKKR